MTTHLNLARSWRSRQFDEIIGQPLAVRILKNSLYTNHFFPVYLLAGERGCGKTTTARVFASALNCDTLPSFQQDPKKYGVPCLTCASCKAMTHGSHPDFIEMDAASHTGVDNVRNIIDAATLMPVLGRKRVYLIDEAHMLSKAAFNAFLKLLEEPPASVIFMLATTDPHKIIDTVRSRCFQLFFNPVSDASLFDHLKNICDTEQITYEVDGLTCIVEESKGLVRDALNLLEQVRFAGEIVSKHQVQTVLGHLDDERLVVLFQKTVAGDIADLLTYIKEISLASADAEFIWEKIQQFLRSALWRSYGIHDGSQTALILEQHNVEIATDEVICLLDIACDHELLFYKTNAKYSLLEMILIRMCMRKKHDLKTTQNVSPSHDAHIISRPEVSPVNNLLSPMSAQITSPAHDNNSHGAQEMTPQTNEQWQSFLQQLELLNDQLLPSLFKQANVCSIEDGKVMIQLPQRLAFFEDMLKEHEKTWIVLLQKLFGQAVTLQWEFADIEPSVIVPAPDDRVQMHRSSTGVSSVSPPASRSTVAIDVSNKEEWKLTHALLAHFPGTVSELTEEGS